MLNVTRFNYDWSEKWLSIAREMVISLSKSPNDGLAGEFQLFFSLKYAHVRTLILLSVLRVTEREFNNY